MSAFGDKADPPHLSCSAMPSTLIAIFRFRNIALPTKPDGNRTHFLQLINGKCLVNTGLGLPRSI
jgi:hypothetical protein